MTRDATPDLLILYACACKIMCHYHHADPQTVFIQHTQTRCWQSAFSFYLFLRNSRVDGLLDCSRVESSISLPLCSRLPFSVLPGTVCPATGAVQGRRLILAPPAGMAQQGRDRETRLCLLLAVAVSLSLSLSLTSAIVCLKV